MSPLEPAVPVLDNSATRGDLVALRTLAERHIIDVTLPPHMTPVKQPVDVCWARSFRSSYRRFLRRLIEEESFVKALNWGVRHETGFGPWQRVRGSAEA